MSPCRTAILISGSGSNMVALAQSMTGDHPARPVLVLSNDVQAGGLAKARAMGIPTFAVDHRPFGKDRAAFEAELTRALKLAKVDLICLAGFMRVLSPDFIAEWEGRMLNIHPSLLPLYKGLHTHERALANADVEHGCSVHEVTAALDDGPLLGQARLTINPDETAESLAARVQSLEHKLYPAVLLRFAAGDRTPVILGAE